MNNRFLHFLLSLLLLVWSPIGVSSQTAMIDKSDDVKVVTVYSSSQELNPPLLLTESEVIERSAIRSQKKSVSSQESLAALFFAKSNFLVPFQFSSSSTLSKTRVLLLPKSIQTLIFLQTLV